MINNVFPVISELERRLPFYLVGVGCDYHQEHIRRPQGYPNFQWIQCHYGEGELMLEGDCYKIGPQQGMFLYPDVPHEYYETQEPWKVDWIGFNGYLVAPLVNSIGLKNSTVYYVNKNADLILVKMRQALTIAASNDHFKGMECSGLIYQILLDLFKYTSYTNDDSVQQKHFRLQPVFDYIDKNYSKAITLEELAGTINVTPQHLCLLFKNILRMRPFEYLNHIRIKKSKELIFSKGDLTIKAIAQSVGYESDSYFCASFKEIEGISPGQFRKLHGIY